MKHSFIKVLSLIFICNIFSFSFAQKNLNENSIAIIPYPLKVTSGAGYFTLNNQTHILINSNNESVKRIAGILISKLNTTGGFELKLGEKSIEFNSIFFELNGLDSTLHKEGYILKVNKENILIKARSEAGLFYGLQSLLQLLPKEIESHNEVKDVSWQIPLVEIYDEPRFEYRGLQLDVSRHFMPVSFIKKYLDNMATHKLNTFHWHLTDDQGWRIEIKKYPKLTQVGAWRKETLVGHQYVRPLQFDNTSYGGYYSQEEIKEIVKYAAERYITIIPEIDMPGHATAAIAAYPQLGVLKDTTLQVATRWGVFPNLYNVNDSTFHFLEDVLTEVMELFPSRYIHVGGDEVRIEQWEKSVEVQSKIRELGLKNENELQSFFIKRIEKFINSKGREIIGWDEILEGGLAPNALVMSWRGEEGSILAANLGHKVIMAPVSNLYFDFYQGASNDEPLAIGGYTPLRKVYSYNPIPDQLRDKKESNFIIGAQANVWTEYLKDEQDIEYMVFPRIAALSEIVWTDEKNKNWERFSKSIPGHLERYKLRNINYSNSVYNVVIVPYYDSTTSSIKVSLSNELGLNDIRYTLDGSEVLSNSPFYQNPISISKKTCIRAKLFQGDNFIGRECQQMFNHHLGFGKMVKYVLPYDTSVFITNDWTLADGILGDDKNMYSNVWQRFKSDVDVTIDFINKKHIKTFKSSFIQIPGYAFALPSSFEIYVSKDGKKYKSVPFTIISVASPTNASIVHYSFKLKKAYTTNFIRFVAKNPKNKLNEITGKNVATVLMVDEIVVE